MGYQTKENLLMNTPFKSNTINADVLIVGGGVVGMSLAIGLARLRQKVVLIDIKPKINDDDRQMCLSKRDTRVYALNLSSLKLFKSLGVDGFARRADYTQVKVWQGDGRGELCFAKPALTPSLLGSMVEPTVLDDVLNRRIKQPDIEPFLTILHATYLDKHFGIDTTDDGVRVRACDTDERQYHICAHLLVGADGRGSVVRQMAGIGIDYLDYHQTAICCAIKTDLPHANTARQAMLDTGTLALLPLADMTAKDGGFWHSVVWTLPKDMAKIYLTLMPNELADKLALASGFELGAIRQIESIASFDLSAQVAKSYIAAQTLLIGDAAHGVHPLAGQGLNLGLADVSTLLDLIEQALKQRQNPYSTHLLSRYEYIRRSKNALAMHSFSAINYVFTGRVFQKAPFRFLRAEMVTLAGKIRPLLDFFNHKASKF